MACHGATITEARSRRSTAALRSNRSNRSRNEKKQFSCLSWMDCTYIRWY